MREWTPLSGSMGKNGPSYTLGPSRRPANSDPQDKLGMSKRSQGWWGFPFSWTHGGAKQHHDILRLEEQVERLPLICNEELRDELFMMEIYVEADEQQLHSQVTLAKCRVSDETCFQAWFRFGSNSE